jgi:hypothetical protein
MVRGSRLRCRCGMVTEVLAPWWGSVTTLVTAGLGPRSDRVTRERLAQWCQRSDAGK